MSFRRLLACAASAAVVGSAFAALAAAPAAHAASPNLFASVDINGNLINGGGVSSVTHLGVGRNEVTFASDVSGCAYVATPVNAYSQALQAFTAGGHLSTSGVYVETKNQGGGLTDGPFNLFVDCGNPGTQYAVVGYSGNLVRSTSGATMTSPGPGRYNITFPASVRSCSYLASVGDPSSALVFNPAGVYTGSGTGTRTVYVETKNPGGGLSTGIPFHLAAVCPTASSVHTAVAGSDGIIVRGSSLSSSYLASTGNYSVVTNQSLKACATVATRGSANTAVPFDPATVEVTPGPAANTAGIQVRGLLFFGGNLADEAFHTATIC